MHMYIIFIVQFFLNVRVYEYPNNMKHFILFILFHLDGHKHNSLLFSNDYVFLLAKNTTPAI